MQEAIYFKSRPLRKYNAKFDATHGQRDLHTFLPATKQVVQCCSHKTFSQNEIIIALRQKWSMNNEEMVIDVIKTTMEISE